MRVRKHVNPLNYQKDFENLSESVFNKENIDINLEIGCAHGEFVTKLAKLNQNKKFIGFEIRKSLAVKIQDQIEADDIQNLEVYYASSNTRVVNFPPLSISNVYVFFPDPWFKKRHHKRRILSSLFLNDIKTKLKGKNNILFQTDVKDLFDDTKILIEQDSDYKINFIKEDAKAINHTGVASYHEQRCLANGWPIYRMDFSYIATKLTV